MTLDGGGATSQAKAQGVWRATYQDDSGNTVNYEEVGSGTGRENFNSGAYSFAGSDSYLNDDEGELSAAKERCNGEDPIEVPAYVSPIAVAARVSDDTGFFNLKATGQPGRLVEFNATKKMFTNPDETSTEAYISGRFG